MMDIHIKSISEGAINYMRVLGTAKNMIHYRGNIEWIAPQPDTPGPTLVFNISLNSKNADGRIKDIIPEIIAKNIPSFWFITPNATPENIIDILVANGFPDTRIPDDSDDGEPAMALDLCDFVNTYTYENLKIIIVEGYDEFSHWINVVNVALHGWNMLLAENCFNFVSTSGVVFYLAYINDEPVGTLATMRDGNDASLEFVSIKTLLTKVNTFSIGFKYFCITFFPRQIDRPISGLYFPPAFGFSIADIPPLPLHNKSVKFIQSGYLCGTF